MLKFCGGQFLGKTVTSATPESDAVMGGQLSFYLLNDKLRHAAGSPDIPEVSLSNNFSLYIYSCFP